MDRRVIEALEATGLPWSIEQGKGHLKIRVGGRLVGVMGVSFKESSPCKRHNTIAAIRRIAKELEK